mmetsp:Transcript_5583/g.15270  ORF Transcript_5583/g.15270 Transcript_5583/m.15270 type:complete len:80 (-) Transcript_5583:301-540(-)
MESSKEACEGVFVSGSSTALVEACGKASAGIAPFQKRLAGAACLARVFRSEDLVANVGCTSSTALGWPSLATGLAQSSV